MSKLDEVFSAWATTKEMANDLDWGLAAVEKWKERKRIPSDAWPDLIRALKRKGKNIGAAELLAMHTRNKRSPVTQPNNSSNAA